MQLADEKLGLVEHREIYVNELENFSEAGSCGTAAVITPSQVLHMVIKT